MNEKQMGTPIPNSGSSLGGLPNRDALDFGILTNRKTKLTQSQAKALTTGTSSLSFSSYSAAQIISIINGTELDRKRDLSIYYAQSNGMYARAVRYLADIYRFDFMIYPNLDLDADLDEKTNQKTLKSFNEVLEHFDSSSIQLMARKWATQVCIEGAYYGYICDDVPDKLVIQDLPTAYCRSNFIHRGKPVIEFNMQYFDKITNDYAYRQKLLALFPTEIQKGYKEYEKGKLNAEIQGDTAGWLLLDVNRAFKFNFYDTDIPPFLYSIPSLINLAEVQDLEKEKLLQELQKILVQQFDLDNNGQLPFLMEELKSLTSNAEAAVGDAVGISVLSTFANVDLKDMSSDTDSAANSVETAENGVYNEFGISTNLFNTDGNLALEKSIAIDAAFVKQLMLQFEHFFNEYLSWNFASKKNVKFRFKMLSTTIFNNIEMSKLYQDLTKIGFSRFLPMVALGHTQKEVTSMVKLEQQIMGLDNWMLPPFSSNTMSSDTWSQIKEQQAATVSGTSTIGSENSGRPTLSDDQKSEKTIANEEAKG